MNDDWSGIKKRSFIRTEVCPRLKQRNDYVLTVKHRRFFRTKQSVRIKKRWLFHTNILSEKQRKKRGWAENEV